MTLPEGTIIGYKKVHRTERVGIDDTISDEVDGILFVPANMPFIVQVYEKDTERLIMEVKIADLLKVLPPDQRILVLKAMVATMSPEERELLAKRLRGIDNGG